MVPDAWGTSNLQSETSQSQHYVATASPGKLTLTVLGNGARHNLRRCKVQ